MSYSLYVHPDAESDAEDIASYIGERSSDGMLRWLDSYETALARIVSNPLLCSPAAEDPILQRGLRQVLFKTPAEYLCSSSTAANSPYFEYAAKGNHC